ncbi:MAG: trypsin-like serine protease, partial [Candidatus Binatia bacterium]
MLLSVAVARAERIAIGDPTRPRIVNGLTSHAYPTTGALLRSAGGAIDLHNASTWCSGTLIGCRTFLVAAHCVEDLSPSRYLVYLQHAGVFAVAAIARHPDASDESFPVADVAVLTLDDWVTGIAPTPITVVDPTLVIPATGTIVGFGQTWGSGNDYGIKRAGMVQTDACPLGLPNGVGEPDVVCWTFAGPVGPPGEDSNTCNGDSGGPLLLDLGVGPVVAAVTSGGTSGDCLATDHSYDASVHANRSFIVAARGDDATATCGNLPAVGTAETTVIGHDGSLGASNLSDSYTITVPAGANQLRVALNGEDNGSFDVDLYLKAGPGAGPGDFDCKADAAGVFGACGVDFPAPGSWSIAVQRAAGSGDYQITSTILRGTAPLCGDGGRDFNEACDGADAARCPGLCQGDCRCP